MATVKKPVKKTPAKAPVKAAAKTAAKATAKPAAKPTARKPAAKAPAKAPVKAPAKTKAVAKPSTPAAQVKGGAARKTAIASAKPARNTAVKPSGIPEQLRDAALTILNERQADDIVTLELAHRSSVADYMLIASGRAGRQIAAIADYIREAFMKLGVKRVRIEGMAEANWVLIDGGDVIVHLFRPEVRSYYDIDAIWNGKSAV